MDQLEIRDRVLEVFANSHAGAHPLTKGEIEHFTRIPSGQSGVPKAVEQLAAAGKLSKAPGEDYPWSWYGKRGAATYYFPADRLEAKKAEIAQTEEDRRLKEQLQAAQATADRALRERHRAEWDALVAEALASGEKAEG